MTQKQIDKFYLEVAKLYAKDSYTLNLKVGAVIVKDEEIVSTGFNSTLYGFENKCEILSIDKSLHTFPYVLHAASNAILKCANYGRCAYGATLYTTHSPCIESAKLIIQAGIKRVVYLEDYRKAKGIELFKKVGINVEKFKL